MGIYLNPGHQNFSIAIGSPIYVDKTGMIAETNQLINTFQRFVCISRPRRFGKSTAADMLLAYYCKAEDTSELFSRFEIAQDDSYWQYLNQYNVIYLNAQRFLSRTNSVNEMLKYLQSEVIDELMEQYPGILSAQARSLGYGLEKIYGKTSEQFIFIIDEWDCILRDKRYSSADVEKYLDFLRDLLKDQSYVALAYMTGILPIKKYGTHSALNMFTEYSMIEPRQFAQYFGFTEDEVFSECRKWNVDFDLMQQWYDGYTLPGSGHIYNPKSVVEALMTGRFGSYWTRTETYEALQIYIDMNYDGLKDAVIKMISGEKVLLDVETFQNDMSTFHTKDDVLTLLIHLGYLAYDMNEKNVYIPNAEVQAEFLRSVKRSQWNDVIKAIEASDQLLQATWEMDAQRVAQMIDQAHSENTSILSYNDENSLSCVVSLAYYNAINYYHRVREFPSGKGFADIVFLPKRNCDKPALIIELKYQQSARGAIDQIKERRYPDALTAYSGQLLLVGINYDKSSKQHSCIIEPFECE